jgi:predicted TPR repeat methyltransferase
MQNIYNDGTYLQNNPNWHEEDAVFKSDRIIDLIERNKIDIKNIAEIGCGTGEIIIQLATHFKNINQFYGFDISADAIHIAKQKERDKIKFENKDISIDSQYFDLILIIDVIEHIENYFQFLSGISTKSKYTLFHIPLDISIRTLFKEKMLIESKESVGHIHNFTEEFILSILNDYGFEIIDKKYTEPSFDGKGFKQKIVKTLQKTLYKISPRFCSKTMGGCSIMVLTKNKTV